MKYDKIIDQVLVGIVIAIVGGSFKKLSDVDAKVERIEVSVALGNSRMDRQMTWFNDKFDEFDKRIRVCEIKGRSEEEWDETFKKRKKKM